MRNVELKLANVKEFKTLFQAELNVILVRLENLKKMLADNVYNDETKDGLITIDLWEYYLNLKLGQEELSAMLDTEI